jgi:hypothetical protein
MTYIVVLLNRAERSLDVRLSNFASEPQEAAAALRMRRRWARTRRLMIVPIAFTILHLPGTLRRTSSATGWCEACLSASMSYLQGICDPSQGTLNAVLYAGLDASFQSELQEVLLGWFTAAFFFLMGRQPEACDLFRRSRFKSTGVEMAEVSTARFGENPMSLSEQKKKAATSSTIPGKAGHDDADDDELDKMEVKWNSTVNKSHGSEV